MIRHHFKTAVRNLVRHKTISAINVAGLAIGMACCLLIMFYVYDELQYDEHHENADRIYRITAEYATTGRHWACIGPPVGLALLNQIPEIEQVFRFFEGSHPVFSYGQTSFEEPDVLYADSSIFEVLSINLKQGNPVTALSEPGSLLLTDRMAKKYFGDADPMGRVIMYNASTPLKVTGVLENQPSTSHAPFDFLISMSTFYSWVDREWIEQAKTWAGFHTYILLRSGATQKDVEQKLPEFVSSYYAGRFSAPAEEVLTLHLQPLTDIHLYSKLEKELRSNSDIAYVYIFSTIAFVVLLVACVNFVNLAAARFIKRIREVGVRKVLGAMPRQLTMQFLTEAVLMTFLSVAIAVILAEAMSPLLLSLTGKQFSYGDVDVFFIVLGIGGIALGTALLSGIVPTFAVSGSTPVSALRGTASGKFRISSVRKALIISQFSVSVFLIVGVIVINSQLNFIRQKDLGFDKEQVVKVSLRGKTEDAVEQSREEFLHRLGSRPQVVKAGLGSEAPGERFSLETIVRDDRKDERGVQMRVLWGIDDGYIPTLGIEIVRGRNFVNSMASDSMAFLLNESAVKVLELSEPLGTVLRWGNYVGPVVGVVRDFHFASLHRNVEPLFIPHRVRMTNYLFVRIAPDRADEALSVIREELEALVPDQPFLYSFLDQDFDKLYRGEDLLGKVFQFFTILAVLIACLGLFGLSMLAVERRTKEVGIRKVLGANVTQVVGLLSREFLLLVSVSNLVGWPLAWFALSSWLENFAFRTEIEWWMFLIAGVLSILTAFATVAFHGIKAAMSNPVDALRYE